MTYYRIAFYNCQTATWIWRTTVVTSLQVVLQLLKSFGVLPQDRIRVFTATSKKDLNEMLGRENIHLTSGSATAAQFLRDRKLQIPGQHTSEYGAAEPAIQQTMAVTTISPLRESSTITGFPGFSATNLLERRYLEIENGPGGNHDIPYRFTLPISTPQLLAWARMQARVQVGELQP